MCMDRGFRYIDDGFRYMDSGYGCWVVYSV